MSIAACAGIVKRADEARFLSAMTAPPTGRARLFALYAFNVEVARAPWASNEALIAEMRLQFWADLIGGIGKGRTTGSHEIAEPLAGVISECGLPLVLFEQMIEARRRDIYSDPFRDAAEFERYIDHTSGNLMWLAARALGAGDGLETNVCNYAYGVGVANWLLSVPELRARAAALVGYGRCGDR